MDEFLKNHAQPAAETPNGAAMASTNEKSPCAGNTGPLENHSFNGRDYPLQRGASKALLKAQFAHAGYLVYDDGDGDFFVVRVDWLMSRYCSNFAALVAFARIVGLQ